MKQSLLNNMCSDMNKRADNFNAHIIDMYICKATNCPYVTAAKYWYDLNIKRTYITNLQIHI